MHVCRESGVSAYYSHCRPSSACFAWMIREYGCVCAHVGAITAKGERKSANRPHSFQCDLNVCRRKDEGEKKGVVVNKGRQKSWSSRDN